MIIVMKKKYMWIFLSGIMLFIIVIGAGSIPQEKGTDIFNGRIDDAKQDTGNLVDITIHDISSARSISPVKNIAVLDAGVLSEMDRRVKQQYGGSFMPSMPAPVNSSSGAGKDNNDFFSFDDQEGKDGDGEIVLGWLNQDINNNEIDAGNNSGMPQDNLMKQMYDTANPFSTVVPQQPSYGFDQFSGIYDSSRKSSLFDDNSSLPGDDKESVDIFNKDEIFNSYKQNYNYGSASGQDNENRSIYDVNW